jgi:DNA protecting protein DprA
VVLQYLLQKANFIAVESHYIIALSHHGLTLARYKKLTNSFQKLENAWESRFENKDWSWLKEQNLNIFSEHNRIQNLHAQEGIQLITCVDSNYPADFKHIDNFPLVLYCKGNVELLKNSNLNLTVVGSRNHSKYAQMIVDSVLPKVVSSGVFVVSGLAEGVDGLSHEISVKYNLPTIAVIGSGLDLGSFYPKSNWKLFQDILSSNGLVISEYPCNTKPKPFHYPQRNRLLAALSRNIWVVEASVKSGSMTTVEFAKKYSKHLLTCPANLFEDHCSGNIVLIKQGAEIVFDSDSILHHYDLEAPKKSQSQNILLSEFSFLAKKPLHIDEISKILEQTHPEVLQKLSLAELSGEVKHLGENRWELA